MLYEWLNDAMRGDAMIVSMTSVPAETQSDFISFTSHSRADTSCARCAATDQHFVCAKASY